VCESINSLKLESLLLRSSDAYRMIPSYRSTGSVWQPPLAVVVMEVVLAAAAAAALGKYCDQQLRV